VDGEHGLTVRRGLSGRCGLSAPAVAGWVLTAVLALLSAGCGGAEPPIRVTRDALVVENQTREEWHDVTVTVNGYYRGTSKTLAAGGRLDASLGNFVTGLGQRFDKNRERVTRVEVRATDASGDPVALDWPAAKK
jgi:hypothetical protein